MCFGDEWSDDATRLIEFREKVIKIKRRDDDDFIHNWEAMEAGEYSEKKTEACCNKCCIGFWRKSRALVFFSLLNVISIAVLAVFYMLAEAGPSTKSCLTGQLATMDAVAKQFGKETEWGTAKADLNMNAGEDAYGVWNTVHTGIFTGPTVLNCDMAAIQEVVTTGELKFDNDGALDFGINQCTQDWTFMNSAYFVFTISTTIGYGYTAPNTIEGYWLFIITSIPCIIVGGFMIGAIGGLLKHIFDQMGEGVAIRCGKKEGVPKNCTDCRRNCEENKGGCFAGEILKVVMIGIPCFLLPAISYTAVGTCGENRNTCVDGQEEGSWGILDAMYFHIVSSTTIGFGDLGLLFDGTAMRDKTIGRNFLNTMLIYLGLGAFGAYSGVLIDTFKNLKNFADEVLCTTCGKKCSRTSDWDETSYDGFVDPKDSFFDLGWKVMDDRRQEDPAPRWFEYFKNLPKGERGMVVVDLLGSAQQRANGEIQEEEIPKAEGDSVTTSEPVPEERKPEDLEPMAGGELTES